MRTFSIRVVVSSRFANGFWAIACMAACLALLLSSAPRAQAQATSGITGTVTDGTGAVVAGASVTATNPATGVATRGVTATSGAYTIIDLIPGPYTVKIEKAGFQTFVANGVAVEPGGKRSTVDAALKTGEVREVMEVTAQAITLETEQPQLATTIEHKIVEELPLEIGGGPGSVATVGRQIDDYIFLAPGTQGGEFSHRINGGVDFENEVVFNGVAAVQAETQGFETFINPPFEMVSEFSVLTSVFSAQYGLAQGVVSYTFASGTNNLHGDVFESMRNSYFFAPGVSLANAHPDGTCCEVPLLVQHNYGFALGGPVWIPHLYDGKNKTFWHFDLEWFRQNSSQTGTMTVPTTAEVGGDFSGLVDGNGTPINIYVPTAWASNPALIPSGCTPSVAPGQQWPGNKIPSTCISAASALVTPLIATPNIPGTIANNVTSQAGIGVFRQPNWGFSIDHNLTEKQKIHGSFWRDKETTPSCCNNNALYPLNSPITGQNPQDRLGTGFFLTYSNALTNHLVMTAGFGWMGEINNQFNPNVNKPFPGVAGSVSFPHIHFASQDPNATEPSDLGQALTYSLNRKLGLSFANNWLWIHGKHTFNTGAEIHRAYQDDDECQGCGGNANFNSRTTSDGTDFTTTGDGFASFLLGQVDSTSRSFSPESRLRNLAVSPYVQDNIKVNPKLTVNAGLRWDILRPFTENKNNFVFFQPNIPNPGAIDPATGQPLLGAATMFGNCTGCAGYTHGYVQWTHFSPRLGFTYEVNRKTVVLGGFSKSTLNGGAFEFGTDKVAQGSGQWLAGALPTNGNNSAVPGWGEWDTTPIGNPPAVPFSPSVANTLTNAASGGGLREFSPSATAPYALSWNLGVQHELPWNLFLSASYVGNRILHLPSMLNEPNQVGPAALNALCPNPEPDATGHVTSPTCLLSPDNPNGTAWTGAPQQAALQAFGLPLAPAITCPLNSNNPGLSQPAAYAPYATFACDWGTGFSVQQAVLPYPMYSPSESAGGLANTWDMTGTAFYNALQVQGQKRFTNGLSFLVSYTLSKTMANTDTGFATFNNGAQNRFNQKEEWSLASNDQTHNLTMSGVYELPIGPHKKFANYNNTASRLLLGGWQVSGVLSYTSGMPQAVYSYLFGGGFYDVYGNALNRANSVSGQPYNLNYRNYYKALGASIPEPTIFNTNAFAFPGYTGGDSPREIGGIRSAFGKNENVGLGKHFHFTERVDAELRMEFFNVLNRVIPCTPDTNLYDGALKFGVINNNGTGGSNPCQANSPRQGQAFFNVSF
jgi:Carboxypeptidase regulatory-like domain